MKPSLIQNHPAEIWLFQPPAVLELLELQESEPLCVEALFGNSNPVEVEIGCGKGRFLLERAAQYPGVNFLGIDRVAKWMKIGQKRSVKRNLSNLKFIKTNAVQALQRFPPETVSVFHVYFPDPWPKRRHRKRRLVTKDFLELLRGQLIGGGRIEMATDDEDYFLQMKKAADAAVWSSIREGNGRLAGTGKTNYEIKYEAAGRALYYLELQK